MNGWRVGKAAAQTWYVDGDPDGLSYTFHTWREAFNFADTMAREFARRSHR